MVKGKTESGFEYEIDEKIVKSWRFVKEMAKLNTGVLGRMEGLVNISSMLLGEDQEEKLMNFISEKEGYADAVTFENTLTEIITSIGKEDSEVKN